MTIPTHLSYSQLKTYEECPRQYYLGKVRKAPERQTWFMPMGTAVHISAEEFVKTGEVPEFEQIFYPLIEDQLKADPDDVNWSAAGSADQPIIRKRAVDLGKACVERVVKYLEDIDVWEVEYNASAFLPGCEVEIWAFIDILGEHKKHGPVAVDWKTGKRKPKNNLQLQVYRALLMQNPEFDTVKTGLWGMVNPDASIPRRVDLSDVDDAAMGARFQRAYDDIERRMWKAVPGFDCKFCLQERNCLAISWGSPTAKEWDNSEEDGVPF